MLCSHTHKSLSVVAAAGTQAFAAALQDTKLLQTKAQWFKHSAKPARRGRLPSLFVQLHLHEAQDEPATLVVQ